MKKACRSEFNRLFLLTTETDTALLPNLFCNMPSVPDFQHSRLADRAGTKELNQNAPVEGSAEKTGCSASVTKYVLGPPSSPFHLTTTPKYDNLKSEISDLNAGCGV